MINNLTILTNNFEGTNVNIITDKNGDPLFELYSTGMALGQTKEAKGKLYARKDRIDQNIINADISPIVRDGQQYLNEEMLYDFMLEVKTDKCKPFRKWVTHDVLPTIRKTGGFVADEEQFINTYLPFADDHIKLLFKSTLEVVNSQNKQIEQQQNVIDHKTGIIKGLIEDMTLADKRQILNRVVMKCSNFNDRWAELYKNYEMKFHVHLDSRLNSYNKNHKPQLRNKLEYIEVMGKIDELFSIACKLYENEVNILVNELYKLNV